MQAIIFTVMALMGFWRLNKSTRASRRATVPISITPWATD
jgi:hypothetical protein